MMIKGGPLGPSYFDIIRLITSPDRCLLNNAIMYRSEADFKGIGVRRANRFPPWFRVEILRHFCGKKMAIYGSAFVANVMCKGVGCTGKDAQSTTAEE